MVTFFLLTLLGGAVAALVVADSESDKRATDQGSRHRAQPLHERSRATASAALRHLGRSLRPVPTAPGPASPPRSGPAGGPPTEGTGRRLVARPVDHHLDPRAVPRRSVALDGTYAQVTRMPVWRRALSLALLAVLTVAGGVLAAAVLGGTVAVLGELVDRTIQ